MVISLSVINILSESFIFLIDVIYYLYTNISQKRLYIVISLRGLLYFYLWFLLLKKVQLFPSEGSFYFIWKVKALFTYQKYTLTYIYLVTWYLFLAI